MNIKITYIQEKKKQTFPCLMKNKFGAIILATAKSKGGAKLYGFLLKYGDKDCMPEQIFHDEFISSMFEPFEGSITLSND